MTTLLVGIAGALGAVARYRIGTAIGLRSFPWATLLVNVVGCFLLALVLAGPAGTRWSDATTAAVAVGFLGAFTTFSTFGWETFTLLRADDVARAATYVGLSLAGGLAATALGWAAGRALS
ncbi:MAG: fluoride efflux transporter CrcB [Acidimicrobiia bacterium]